jgi:hypothetical protein
MVTHAHHTVTTHAPKLSRFITTHTANAVTALVGIVKAIAAALLNVTTLPLSPKTNV